MEGTFLLPVEIIIIIIFILFKIGKVNYDKCGAR